MTLRSHRRPRVLLALVAAAGVGALAWKPAPIDAGPDDAPQPTTIEFRIVGGDGSPVPNVLLTVSGPSLGVTHTVRGGRVVFAAADILSVTAYRAWPADGGEPLPWGPVTWKRPSPPVPTTVELRMPPERSISGFLRAAADEAHSELIVDARESDADVSDHSTRYWAGSVRNDGAFRVGGLGEGEYVLQVRGERYPPWDHVRARSGGKDVVLAPRRGIRATVTTIDVEGRPVEGATVTASRPRGAIAGRPTGYTDAGGVVTLSGLDPDETYVLEALDPRGPIGGPWAGARLLWRPADLKLTLALPKTVRGVVRDSKGRPVSGARVFVVSRDGGADASAMTVSWDEMVTADDEGRFTKEHMGPVPIQLWADVGERPGMCIDSQCLVPHPEAAHWTGRVTTAAHLDEPIVVPLDPGLPLEVRFDDLPEGKRYFTAVLADEMPSADSTAPVIPVSGTDLQLSFDFSGATACTVSDSVARFRCLRPDHTYSLSLLTETGSLVAFARGCRGGEAEQRMRFEPGLETKGRIHVPADAIDPSVVAQVGGLRFAAVLETDGRFRFPALPRGTCTVVATAERVEGRALDPFDFHRWLRPDYRAAAEVEAGGSVDLVLAPRK